MGWVTEAHPTKQELDSCVQCGLCLPHCPTFRLTGRETFSPRGRLQAMKAVAEGVVDVDAAFQSIIDTCLGCRACEPVCPGLVPYGRALEGTRTEIVAQRPSLSHRLRRVGVGRILSSRRTLSLGTFVLRMIQALRLAWLVPSRYRQVVSGLRPLRRLGPSVIGHVGGSGKEGTVALLAGCVQEQWFRPVNRAAIWLLELSGYRVEIPVGQTCCGALAAHDGKAREASRLVEVNVGVFSGYDRVVGTAAGCSAHLREYGHWSVGGEAISESSMDVTVAISRAIDDGLLPRLQVDSGPIGIQDPCHLRHAQRIVEEPRNILEAAGYQVVEIDPAAMCCGAAGLYSTLQPVMSRQLGNLKADQIRLAGVSRVASANPGCEMQMRSVLRGEVVIAHPIEWYMEALAAVGGRVNVSGVEDHS